MPHPLTASRIIQRGNTSPYNNDKCLIESAKVQLFFYLTTLPYGFVKKNTPCTVSAVLLCVKILPNKTISPPNQDNTSQNRQHIHNNISIEIRQTYFNIRYYLLSEIDQAPSWQNNPSSGKQVEEILTY